MWNLTIVNKMDNNAYTIINNSISRSHSLLSPRKNSMDCKQGFSYFIKVHGSNLYLHVRRNKQETNNTIIIDKYNSNDVETYKRRTVPTRQPNV